MTDRTQEVTQAKEQLQWLVDTLGLRSTAKRLGTHHPSVFRWLHSSNPQVPSTIICRAIAHLYDEVRRERDPKAA